MKRDNKNRPKEMSSKKPVKRYRDVVGVSAENKHEKRDPRFDSMCGEFDEKVKSLQSLPNLHLIGKQVPYFDSTNDLF